MLSLLFASLTMAATPNNMILKEIDGKDLPPSPI